jgi:hypothetical protein
VTLGGCPEALVSSLTEVTALLLLRLPRPAASVVIAKDTEALAAGCPWS